MTKSQVFRVLAVLGWSAACFGGWLLWTWAGFAGGLNPDDPGYAEAATGATISSMCGVGCAGGVWMFGLVVAALIWALVRR